MAGIIPTNKTEEVNKARLGYQAITYTYWATNSEPEIRQGSKVEVGGSLYEFTANENIDNSTNYAGIGDSRWVYQKLVPSGSTEVVCELTTVAPAWNEQKQGYYGTTGTTNALIMD
jgi:hypothetical protein